MPTLQKALLQEVEANRNATPVGDPVPVQFNPTSLKLKLSNQVEGGRTRARQRRQHNGTSSTVLSLELVFDSGDESTTDESGNSQPVSVRTKTAIVEKYVVPKRDSSETPPRLRFQWNELVIIGIVESVDIDFDLFAANGAPLRAKCGLSIKEQDPKYQFLEAGAGARNNTDTTPPGGSTATQPGAGTNDGAQPGGNSNRSGTALDGETAPEFAARMGLDPGAWRGLDVDLSAGLALEAGIEVGFNAGLSINAGLGFSAGVSAGVDLSLKAAVGLEAKVGASTAATVNIDANTAAGFALSASGGVRSAIETVKMVETQTASDKAKQAFSNAGTLAVASTAGATASAALAGDTTALRSVTQPVQPRTPLTKSGPISYSEQQNAEPAPLPPTADRRAIAYGYGVPLRPLYKTAVEHGQPRICPTGREQTRRAEGGPVFRKDPSVAPWIQLPLHDTGRSKADAAQKDRHAHPCGFFYSGQGGFK